MTLTLLKALNPCVRFAFDKDFSLVTYVYFVPKQMVADNMDVWGEVKREHEYEKKQDGGNFKPVSILKKASRLAEARNKEV